MQHVFIVASFTDAWIETQSQTTRIPTQLVASFTDAWIETETGAAETAFVEVASFTDAWIETVWGCKETDSFTVASFTDAWIETINSIGQLTLAESHLLQMRGLKPGDVTRWHFGGVASFTDAWIETDETRDTYRTVLRRIFYRCVD